MNSTGNKNQHKASSFSCIRSFAFSALLSAAMLSTSLMADDTEVFFGQLEGGDNPYPNVMFMIDTSDSMINEDDGFVGSRMTRLREAFLSVIDNTEKFNMGLMRLNGPNSGGTVIAPIRSIDEALCADTECTDVASDMSINNGDDDASQISSTLSTDTTDTTLNLGTASDAIGLRFTNAVIPQGVTITSAELVFNAAQNSSSSTNLQIAVVASDDMPAFDNTSASISSMPTGNSVSWNGVEAWQADSSYSSPSISSLVQQVVDRADYCGGNAMGFIVTGSGERVAKSVEHADNDSSPTLRVTFDSSTIPENGGCFGRQIVSITDHSSSDAFDLQQNNQRNFTSNFLPMPYTDAGEATNVGLRFLGLSIPQGATITSAWIDLEVHTAHSGDMQVDITAEDSASALRYFNDGSSLDQRLVVGASSVNWLETTAPDEGEKVQTPDLSELIEEAVKHSEWGVESPLSFIFTGNSSSPGYREFKAYTNENSRDQAPKLTVNYQFTATPESLGKYLTVRSELKGLVEEMDLIITTPLVGAHYEAANYFLGRDVDFGRERASELRQNRISHPDSYTGGSVDRSPDCHESNLASDACGTETISGSAIYTSPIENSCQANHIVLLSDGAATGNTPASDIQNLTGTACDSSTRNSQRCGVELAKWLSETDHRPELQGVQNISTHTVGFNIANSYLEDIAAAGGGTYYDASSAQELTDVFNSIIEDVSSASTSFVTPATSISQFNRLEHDSELYFALFEPSDSTRWVGNLKRFEISENSLNEATILDKNGDEALDDTTGFFSASSHSFWSSAVDGTSVGNGGAAEQLDTLIDTRNIFTDAGIDTLPSDGLVLNDPDRRLHEDHPTIGQTTLEITNSFSTNRRRIAYRNTLLSWARGTDVDDEDQDGSTTDRRAYIGDPMHSEPVVVNYNTGTDWERSILMSTNEGVLHSIDSDTGVEEWAFMPKELLPNIRHYYENSPSRTRYYGLDGPMSVWIDDTNGNTAIDAGEDAYLFVGMRRGGNNYYAFNISEKDNPRLAWVIRGGEDEGFEELGQTWSKMIPTSMMINGSVRDVLVFAAGYSPEQDDQDSAQVFDSVGRGLYIVDTTTGEKLWSGLASTANGSGINQVFIDMQYSMPSDLRVLDTDQDGLADQLYASDAGSRVWRFDIRKSHQSGDLIDGGIMADLGREGISSTPQNERRFYYEPDVALNVENGQRYLSISIGSGWRSHPLDEEVEDRIYVIRSNAVFEKPEDYGLEVETSGSSYWRPITESDLEDITNELNPSDIENGWMLRLPVAGEKVLGSTLTVNSQLLITTYIPDSNASLCAAAVGDSAIYVVNIANGAPTLDLNGDDDLTEDDRKRLLNFSGISPEPSALFTTTGGVITVGPSQPLPEFDFGRLIKQMYWRDRGKNSSELSLNDNP